MGREGGGREGGREGGARYRYSMKPCRGRLAVGLMTYFCKAIFIEKHFSTRKRQRFKRVHIERELDRWERVW